MAIITRLLLAFPAHLGNLRCPIRAHLNATLTLTLTLLYYSPLWSGPAISHCSILLPIVPVFHPSLSIAATILLARWLIHPTIILFFSPLHGF